MTDGQASFVSMLLALAIAGGVAGLIRLRGSEIWPRGLLVAGSTLIILGWIIILKQHFYVHAWFMTRILVWFIICGFALFAWSLKVQREPIAATGISAPGQ